MNSLWEEDRHACHRFAAPLPRRECPACTAVYTPVISSLPALRNRLRMRHLQLLRALAEKGSLRGAADEMGMTQPAATKALQDLEYLVGAALFIRHPRGLVPTVFGEAITRYANTVLEDMRSLRDELAAVEAGEIGRVRIGAVTAAVPGLLKRAVLALRQTSPRLDISVQVDTSDILVHALNHGLLDLVIGRVPVGWPDEHLEFRHLATEALTLVARVGHPATLPGHAGLDRAGPAGVAPDALRDCGWVLQPNPSPMRGVIDEVFRSWGDFQPSAIIESSSVLTTLTLIRESDMIGVLPQVVGRYFVAMDAIAAIPVPLNTLLPPYGLISRRNREDSPAMQRVAEAILREVQGGSVPDIG